MNFGGSSAAVPHVTGTVALLHQYAAYKIENESTSWWKSTGIARRHEVIKAVLLNSADKILNVHGSQRTIVTTGGSGWENSQADLDPATPLDEQMGAGHLNAQRAFKQYKGGEWDVGEIGSLNHIYPDLKKARA